MGFIWFLLGVVVGLLGYRWYGVALEELWDAWRNK